MELGWNEDGLLWKIPPPVKWFLSPSQLWGSWRSHNRMKWFEHLEVRSLILNVLEQAVVSGLHPDSIYSGMELSCLPSPTDLSTRYCFYRIGDQIGMAWEWATAWRKGALVEMCLLLHSFMLSLLPDDLEKEPLTVLWRDSAQRRGAFCEVLQLAKGILFCQFFRVCSKRGTKL